MKKILFITATHGDEGFSVEIMRQVSKIFPKQVYGYDWIIGNPKAYARNVRFLEKDLNRSAPGNSKSIYYEIKRAKEIIELSREYECVIDIHGTVSDLGIASIVTNPTIQNLYFASMLPIKKRVVWYSKSSLLSGPITRFAKCPAIELECGPKDSKIIWKRLTKTIGRILEEMQGGKIQKRIPCLKGSDEFYVVYGRLTDTTTKLIDFKKTKDGKESFYPFLSNQYSEIASYKMQKISINNLFLY